MRRQIMTHNHHHGSPQAQPIFHHRPSTTTTTTTAAATTTSQAAPMLAIAATSTRSSTTGRDNDRKIAVEGDLATNLDGKKQGTTSSRHNRSHNLIDGKAKTTSSNNTNVAKQGSAVILQSSEMRRPTRNNNISSHHERMEIRSSQRINNRKHPHQPSHDNAAAAADEDGSDSSHTAMIDNHQAAAAAIAVADYDSNDYNESDTNDEDAGLQGYEIVIPNSRSGSISGGGDNDTDTDSNNAAAVVIPSRSNNGLKKDNHRHHRHRRSSRDRATKHASSTENKKEPSQQNDELSQQQLPPGYVYALREIITCNDPEAAAEEEEEEEKKEESSILLADDDDHNRKGRNSSITHPPRMITSQIVRTTESVYHQLEETTAGTVLCRPSIIGEGCSTSRSDARGLHFYASSDLNLESSSSSSLGDDGNTTTTTAKQQQSSLLIAAVSASYIQTKMMEGQGVKTNCPVIACAEEEGHGMANTDNSNDESSDTPKRRKKWRRFPGKLYGSMKKYLVRTKKKKKKEKENASRPVSATENTTKSGQRGLFDDKENTLPTKSKKSATSQYHPKMIINNGIIDWDHSRVDDCRIISQTSSFVTYSTAKSNSPAALKNNGGSSCNSKTTPNINSSSLGATIFGDEAVIHNRIQPINEIVCVDKSLGIYISESGLSASDCQNIINVSEFCASMRGGWSSYTYAKQTLGCRENDQLAFVCARPVMTACATIRKHLTMKGVSGIIGEEKNDDGLMLNGDNVAPGELSTTNDKSCKGGRNNSICDGGDSVGPSNSRPHPCRRKELVLDVREPHVVKYDTSKMERQKLDMHTDKSEWTFLIALSEGRGEDYGGGGTYFQALNSTVHLQRGQMLICEYTMLLFL